MGDIGKHIRQITASFACLLALLIQENHQLVDLAVEDSKGIFPAFCKIREFQTVLYVHEIGYQGLDPLPHHQAEDGGNPDQTENADRKGNAGHREAS